MKYPDASDEYLAIPNEDEVVGFLLRIITQTEATGKLWSVQDRLAPWNPEVKALVAAKGF